MANHTLDGIARQLREMTMAPGACPTPDHELLQRFRERRSEADFEVLLHRHGMMVLCVGERLTHNRHDAEDVFQATFLTLACKAGSLRKPASLASWLHGVAYRIALRARAARVQQRALEARGANEAPADPCAEVTLREDRAVLDEQLQMLAEKYRAPLVLCYLEGATRDEAARRLGISLATLKRRLDKGRELLRARLARRGLSLPAALGALLLAESSATAAAPALLVKATAQSAASVIAGKPLHACLASAGAAALAKEMVRGTPIWQMNTAVLCLALAIVAVGAGMFVRSTSADVAPHVPAQVVADRRAGPERVKGGDAVAPIERGAVATDERFFVYLVQTPLQRELAPREAEVFVLRDPTLALEDGKVVPRELHLRELEKALRPRRQAHQRLHFTIFSRSGPEDLGDRQNAVRLALIGFGHELGFAKVTGWVQHHNNREITWQESSARFTGKPRQPENDERPVVNKFAKAYPVSTELSRYFTSDADCAVVVLPWEKDKATVPQEVRDGIIEAVNKLQLTHKRHVAFYANPVSLEEQLPQQFREQLFRLATDMGFEASSVSSH
jgi:RNA polymerase sigma factor (sigma-70 family)